MRCSRTIGVAHTVASRVMERRGAANFMVKVLMLDLVIGREEGIIVLTSSQVFRGEDEDESE